MAETLSDDSDLEHEEEDDSDDYSDDDSDDDSYSPVSYSSYSYSSSDDPYPPEADLAIPRNKDEIMQLWDRKHAHMQHANNLEAEGLSYMGDLSQTVIFALENVPTQSTTAQLFAVDSQDGTLYKLATRTFDFRFVDYAIEGEIVYFIHSALEFDRRLNSAPREILTYNLLTMNWNSQRLPLEELSHLKSRLWPDGFPAYSSAFYGLNQQSQWHNYFAGCIVDNVAFRFRLQQTKPFLSVASLDHIAQDDANFVSHHLIDLDHCLNGFCNLHFTKCFLNHITGFKFCLLIFFEDYLFYYRTICLCVLTIELSKETTRIDNDHPDQYKARKVETNLFKIQSVLNKRAFRLPPILFPGSCVKQENGESSKRQLLERKYISQ